MIQDDTLRPSELVDALRPFAKLAADYNGRWPDGQPVTVEVSIDDLRQAEHLVRQFDAKA